MDVSQTILAIDTSTVYLSVALADGDDVFLWHQRAVNAQSERILPVIARLLGHLDKRVEDLDAIVYAQGPGAFAGLRVGLGVAQGLAAPFSLPLIGVPTLDAIAHQLPGQSAVLAAMDARMGEVFYAWWDTVQQRRLSDDAVGSVADVVVPDGVDAFVGVGNAFALATPPLAVSGMACMPTAIDYVALARTGAYAAVDADQALLRYVRDKVALTVQEQRAQRNG